KVATMPPPTSPTKSEMIVKKKSINTVEITLGVTNFFVGSVPKARMASICSVTTIDPISLAIPEEFLPATINPVKTGPSSVTMPTDTNCPMRLSDPNLSSVWCRRSEEHTSELQSRRDLVCRLLLEKKKTTH